MDPFQLIIRPTRQDGRMIRERAERLRRARWETFGAIFLAVMGLILILLPYRQQAETEHVLHEIAAASAFASDRGELNRAKAYNQRLAHDWKGIDSDPFDASGRLTDAEYASLLNTDGNGVMGEVLIPSISVSLPIRHGTNADTLSKGAGHLYGSSLPIGGIGSRTVIAAHSYYDADGGMFTRLDELRKGDVFYLRVLGETLAYTVTSRTRVRPDGAYALTPDPNLDEATLLTCSENGNTRLLVTGIRAVMPEQAPYPENAPRDGRRLEGRVVLAATGTASIGCLTVFLTRVRRRPHGRHLRR